LENGMLTSTSVPFSKMPCVFQEVFSHDTWQLSDPWVSWEIKNKKISLNLKLKNALGVGEIVELSNPWALYHGWMLTSKYLHSLALTLH
jgi:hypothetical protein